ncbi:hypothetical protein GCM10010400_00230 [Streptomyces aculeolatus]
MLRRLRTLESLFDTVRRDEKQHPDLLRRQSARPRDRGPRIAWLMCGALIISVTLRNREGAQSTQSARRHPNAPRIPEQTGP